MDDVVKKSKYLKDTFGVKTSNDPTKPTHYNQLTQTININNDQEHNDIYRSAASVGHETEEALTR